MSADHLTSSRPYQLAAGVLAVMAGTDLEQAAAEHSLPPADLGEALEVYQAAGLSALEQRSERDWYQVSVEFSDWDAAETAGAVRLGPLLDDLVADGAVTGWWFLRKQPCWRLRLRLPDTNFAPVEKALNELAEAGLLTRWWPAFYEPETAAFGGLEGIDVIHELFCADSRGVLDYCRRTHPGLRRATLSTLLLSALLSTAGLDLFERGDVFARVAELRPGRPDAAHDGMVTDSLRAHLTDPGASRVLFTPGKPLSFAAPWLRAFETAGRRLGEASAAGRLGRGLRGVLTHVVIFHWNRLGIAPAAQATLARVAGAALLPED
ncbi:thiopeptide-type bacteriocin biosynthesis protein [Nonomuraea candida]|uniref:thiopeptide-type bacteriocin biosynthesis protein n=1 Tax=Nonomuraea candida TaxID=359159 RepID=UPI0005B97797|nr:thiopeptide-type bacteriocin biosynthesis protein [Nonomuraea candida]